MNPRNPNTTGGGRAAGGDANGPADSELRREVERLVQENWDLKSGLRHVLVNGAGFDQRLFHLSNTLANLTLRVERVEASIVFRFLKWLGRKLLSVGVSVDRGIPTRKGSNDPATSARSYLDWVQEAPLHSLVSEADVSEANRAGIVSSSSDRLRISVLLDASRVDRAELERTLASLDSQRYSEWDLWVCTGPDTPDWLNAAVAQALPGRPVEIVAGQTLRQSVASALERCAGDCTLVVDSSVILEPDAFERWILAMGPDTVAVYSDWDFIDSGSRRHTPRFTPELSPELLSQTLYWGSCFLARTARIRQMNWPAEGGELPLFHDLALRLAQGPGTIPRVAKMLWHRQGGTPAPDSATAVRPVTATPQLLESPNGSSAHSKRSRDPVSVIVCSRNSEQLRKCLKNVLPTLDRADEVIVVAHQSGDGAALEQVATGYSVRLVPYTGAFHFGLMNALGVRASKAAVLCFLNDDVYPVAPDWLDSMLAQAIKPDVGIAGALLLYPDRTIQHAGVAVGGWFFPAHLGRQRTGSPYWPWLRMTREVTAVTGACIVLRRSVWDELGGFDPRFPVNYNDIDLCLRAGARGYRVILETRAVLTHEESRTRVPAVRPEETALFYQRWGTVINAPDKFFNPQLGHVLDSIELPAPWTLMR